MLHVFEKKQGCVYLIRKDSKIDSKTTSNFSGFQNFYEYLLDFYKKQIATIQMYFHSAIQSIIAECKNSL